MQPSLVKQSWILTDTPPLWPLEVFCVLQNSTMTEVINDCDAGIYGHVWDIGASKRGKKQKRELRVFYQDGIAILNSTPLPKFTYEKCLADFLPSGRGMRSTELQKIWCCHQNLIHDLEELGLLQVERDARAATGPNASKLYSRASIVSFLTNRAQVRDPKLN